MDTQEFYNEMDRLVDKGETIFPEYNLDLEAFHHIRAIKSKVNGQRRFNIILSILFLLLVAGVIYVFLNIRHGTLAPQS